MKKLSILTIAPVLALIGVSCSGPTAMQTTEYDDMYYSSSDQTEYLQPTAQASAAPSHEATAPATQEQPLSEGEVLNPEYSQSNATIENYDGDEYYDGREYNPRNNWYRPSYSFVDPYWASAVYDPWYPSYSRYNPYGRYSPYGRYGHAFYDPFYDPFYQPYYGSGLSISLALGYGWGSPWGHHYGYSRWPYNSYYNGFYNGYYTGRYNSYNNYYNNYYYDRPFVVNPRKVQYGPRDQRSVVPTTGERTAGRPVRGQQQSVTDEQRVVSPGTATDRPARPVRSSRSTVTPGTTTREALPARPNPTENINRRSERGTRQPVYQQQQQQREVRPAQQQERAPRRYRESVPSTERSQPVRQQRTTESRPSYEPRQSSTPSYEPRRESSSTPAPSNNSGGGGRPRRGN